MAQCVLQSDYKTVRLLFWSDKIDADLMVVFGVSSTKFLSDSAQKKCEAVGLSITCSFYMLSTCSNQSSASKHKAESTSACL